MKKLIRLLVSTAFLCVAVNVYAVAYWNCSSPTGPASGTWNNNPGNLTWATADVGISATGGPVTNAPVDWLSSWNGGGALSAAFSLGSAANGVPGPYTITVDNSFGQVQSADILVYNGPMTLSGGRLDISDIINNSESVTGEGGLVFNIHTNQVAYFNLNITNSVGAFPTTTLGRNVFGNKEGYGTLFLGATNTFVGDIAVKSGILGLAVDQAIPNASSLVLLNGSDIGGPDDQLQDTPPVFNTGGHNQTFNQLVLAGPNALVPRTIDFMNGNGALIFTGNTSTNAWTTNPSIVFGDSNPGPINLIIQNFKLGSTKLRFGTDNTGLTPVQLAQIHFANYGNTTAQIDASGFVTPALPVIISVAKSGSTVTLNWTSPLAGKTYTVQYKNSLTAASWTVLSSSVTTVGTNGTYQDTTATSNTRFYEVIQNP